MRWALLHFNRMTVSLLKKFAVFTGVSVIAFAILSSVIPEPLNNSDVWLHIKSGEVIAKQGILYHDVFTHDGPNRLWLPTDWLFQYLIYKTVSLFGLVSIRWFTAGLAVLQTAVIYAFLKKIFGARTVTALSLCFLFITGEYEFFAPRPQVLSTLFLLLNFYLIYTYLVKDKNRLWLTIPVTYFWSNLHSSVGMYVCYVAALSVSCLAYGLLIKDKKWRNKSLLLLMYTGVTALSTILPPLGFTQYQFIVYHLKYQALISEFISETHPLSTFQDAFILYTIFAVIAAGSGAFLVLKNRLFRDAILLVPFAIMIISGYPMIRFVLYGYIGLVVVYGWILSRIRFSDRQIEWIADSLIMLVLTGVSSYVLYQKWESASGHPYFFPEQAVRFIKKAGFTGSMFNEFTYGGYLLYSLYPDKTVFVDGRCHGCLEHEIADYLPLLNQNNAADDVYRGIMNTIWNKYGISYAILKTQPYSYSMKMANILYNDPDWTLVYWDDKNQIFVRHDGKNNALLGNYGVKYALPYGKLYRENKVDEALAEYRKMNTVAESAHSHNAIGYLLWLKKDTEGAKRELESAIKIDPGFELPYISLAQLAVQRKEFTAAIDLFRKAFSLRPDESYIAIQLGQLYAQKGDRNSALEVWKQGMEKAMDTESKDKLQRLMKAYGG